MSDGRRPDTTRPAADAERDRHLLAALRHAPDHEASAPAALGREIARQARASLPPPRRLEGKRVAWWDRLLGVSKRTFDQPALGGALATLVLGGFIGLMWREGVPPEALPGAGRGEMTLPAPPAATAASTAAAPARPVTVAAPALNEAARVPVMQAPGLPPVLRDANDAAPKPGAAQSSERRDTASQSKRSPPPVRAAVPEPAPAPMPGALQSPAPTLSAQTSPESPAVPLPRPPTAPSPAPVLAQDPSRVRQQPPAPVAAPAPAMAYLPASTPQAAAATPELAPTHPKAGGATAAAPRPASRAAKETEDASSNGVQTASPLGTLPSGHPELLSARRSAAQSLEPPDPLARPLAQLAADAGDNPKLEADRRQLLALQRLARGLWRSAPPLPEAAGQTVLDAHGRVLGRLLVRGQEVSWHSAEGSWRAQLPAAPLPR